MASNTSPVVDRIRIIPRGQDFLQRTVGSSGDVYYNRDTNSLRIYSGKFTGGFELLSDANVPQVLGRIEVATVKYPVTVTSGGGGNIYIIDGVHNPPLDFVVGYTYSFDQSDQTNLYYPNPEGGTLNMHPLHFSSDNANGELGGGSSYTTGVVYLLDERPVPRDEYIQKFNRYTNRRVQITVTNTTPTTLYYYCSNHLGMGNQITTALPGSGGGGAGGTQISISDTAPGAPSEGNLWLDSSTGILYVYFDDANGDQYWIQPSAPVSDGFTSVSIKDSDSAQIVATTATDNITFEEGPGIELLIDSATNTMKISSVQTPGNSGSIGNFLFASSNIDTDDSSAISITPAITAQSDITVQNDLRVDNTAYATNFVTTGTGTATIDSASTLNLQAQDGVIVSGSQFRLPSFTTTERNTLTASNGDLIYNTTANKIQGYQNGAWINLEDGAAA
jgi:hypothetical protein